MIKHTFSVNLFVIETPGWTPNIKVYFSQRNAQMAFEKELENYGLTNAEMEKAKHNRAYAAPNGDYLYVDWKDIEDPDMFEKRYNELPLE